MICVDFNNLLDIPDGKIGKLREKLLKLMTRIFEHPFYQDLTETEQELHYYQSFHDIAAILILKFGYKNGLKFLERLCRSHLRDFMDADFSHTKAFSQFVIELVKRLDKDLAEKLESIQMPPFFFVSWCLAWFSHDLELSSEISSIFDGLVMLPPAAVGYVSALLIHRGRDLVLNYDAELGSDGFGHLHQSLKTLPRDLWSPTILADAHALMLQYPPSTIIGKDPILARSSFDQDLAPSQRPIIYGKYAVVGIPLAILLFAIILKAFDGRPTIDHA